MTARLLWLGAGFAVWASALSLLYGLHALGCAYDWSSASIRTSMWLVLGAHLAALAGLGWGIDRIRAPSGEAAVVWRLSAWCLLAALAATLLGLVPPLFLSTCL